MPFHNQDCTGEAEIVLAQVTDRRFQLRKGFCYRRESRTFVVTPDDLPDTDLATVPFALRWFASGYGRHTLAALLHDYLLEFGPGLDPTVNRVEADLFFRQAMADLRVPLVRRWLMWAGVTLGTRIKATSLASRIGVVLWILLATVGSVTFGVALATADVALGALAAVGPILFAVLWGRQAFAAVVAGYGVLIVGIPTVAVLAGWSVYWVAEQLVNGLRKAKKANREVELPGPTPYGEL